MHLRKAWHLWFLIICSLVSLKSGPVYEYLPCENNVTKSPVMKAAEIYNIMQILYVLYN